MKTPKKSKSIGAVVIYKFLRARGASPVIGVSLYQVASDCLMQMGHAKADETHKRHCKVNEDVILLAAKTAPTKASRKKADEAKPAFCFGGFSVTSPEFLSTYEWRRVRMVALKKYGPKCQCCGASPATGAVMNVDHIKPRRVFPELALEVSNLQILCNECNHGKGNWDMTDWRPAEVLK